MRWPQGTMPPGDVLRRATPQDAPVIAAHRAAMVAGMGAEDGEEVARLTPWAARQLAAGAGLLLDWPPHFMDPHPLHSHRLNVSTHPDHPGGGPARRLTGTASAETRARGIRVLSLHASEAGRPVSGKLGFTPTNEMRLTLEGRA